MTSDNRGGPTAELNRYPTALSVSAGSLGVKNCFLPAGWDDGWRSAKAAATTTPAWVTSVGDSIGFGSGASDYLTTSWWARLRAAFQGSPRSLPLYGDFWSTNYNSADGPGPTASPPLTLGGSPVSYFGGIGRVYMWPQSSAMDCVTFETPYACTAIDIVTLDYSAGSWQYSVDGGPATTVTVEHSYGNAGARPRRESISGLSLAPHIITLGNTSDGNVLVLMGFATYPNGRTAGGIGYANLGQTGIAAANQANPPNGAAGGGVWADTSQMPADKIALLQGIESGQAGLAQPASATGFGFPTQPSLAIVELGLNDSAVTHPNDTLAAYESALRRFVQSFRRGRANCSVLFLAPWLADSNAAGDPAGGSAIITNDYTSPQDPTWYTHVSAMWRIAETFNCAIANVHNRWGQTPYTDGLTVSPTDLHPNDTGHADIAAFLAQVL